MRKLYLFAALVMVLMPPIATYYYLRLDNIRSYQHISCRANINESYSYDKSGNVRKLKGNVYFDFKNKEIDMSFYFLSNNSLRWRGGFSFDPEYDALGRLKAMTIETVHPVTSLLLNGGKESDNYVDSDFVEGKKYPLRFYSVNGFKNIYFLKFANHIGFCINES